MGALTVREEVHARELTLSLLERLFPSNQFKGIGFRLWDGTRYPSESPSPTTTIVLNHPGALRAMLLPGTEVGLVEAYLYNDFDIEGNIEAVFPLGEVLAERTNGWQKKLDIARELMRLPNQQNPRISKRGAARLSGKPHSLERDRQAVRYHYDVSNDFYSLFLGKRMVYSCAYFESPDEDLDTAQERKLDYICRKLRLKPGQKLLDLGCGWGGLVIYAAERYGVDVTGITLSEPQASLAQQRIAEAGLQAHARVRVQDYREVEEWEQYDALVSVGMFEHVGEKLLPVYFERAYRLLKPGGVFLNHGIARRAAEKGWDPQSFSNAYVFPDGELVPISTTLRAAEESGFEVRDVESLREHYALTLRRWVANLEAHHTQALQFVEESTYRVWRIYMSGSAHGFASGRLNVYQSLLVKPAQEGESKLPLSRKDWYIPG